MSKILPRTTASVLGVLIVCGGFATSVAAGEEGGLPSVSTSWTLLGFLTLKQTTLRTTEPAIECTKVKGEGKLLEKSDQHAVGSLTLEGCNALGFSVNTLGSGSGIVKMPALFLICLTNSAKLVFGLLIQPTETVHTEIPSLGTLLLLKGALIAENLSSNEAKEFKMDLEGSEGDQKRTLSCTINGKEFKHTFESAIDSNPDEHTSWTLSFGISESVTISLMDT